MLWLSLLCCKKLSPMNSTLDLEQQEIVTQHKTEASEASVSYSYNCIFVYFQGEA